MYCSVVQVSAHGTGAGIPPVDEQVVRLKLITPAMAALELSEASNPKLFRLAKVGLGLLGVVSELTLQCVDAHELLEETTVRTVEVCLRYGMAARDTSCCTFFLSMLR